MFVNEIMPKICSKFYCEKCDYKTSKKSSYENHLVSIKHNKTMVVNQIMPKLCSKFYCDICDYGTSKKSSYDNHLVSAKHLKSMVSNEILPKFCSEFICPNCSKKYKDNSGLWRHKKKCIEKEKEMESNELNEQNVNNIVNNYKLYYFTKRYLYYATTYHYPF